jgi:hypothetical protein
MTSFVRLTDRKHKWTRNIQQQNGVIQVGANSSLVLIAKALVDILVHEGSLTDPVEEKGVRVGTREREGRETDPLSPRMITWERRGEEDEKKKKTEGKYLEKDATHGWQW